MPAQGGGAAMDDCTARFALVSAERMRLLVGLAMEPENVGQFAGRFVRRRRTAR
jgi:hypothetical protein